MVVGAVRDELSRHVRDGVLYRNYKYLGQDYEQLVLPVNCRSEVMKLAHEIYAGHLGAKRPKKELNCLSRDLQLHLIHQCHKKRRVAVYTVECLSCRFHKAMSHSIRVKLRKSPVSQSQQAMMTLK